MLKFKGVVYPVSVYKFTLADEIADRLDKVRHRMGDINGNEAISLCINIAYNIMRERERQIELESKSKDFTEHSEKEMTQQIESETPSIRGESDGS